MHAAFALCVHPEPPPGGAFAVRKHLATCRTYLPMGLRGQGWHCWRGGASSGVPLFAPRWGGDGMVVGWGWMDGGRKGGIRDGEGGREGRHAGKAGRWETVRGVGAGGKVRRREPGRGGHTASVDPRGRWHFSLRTYLASRRPNAEALALCPLLSTLRALPASPHPHLCMRLPFPCFRAGGGWCACMVLKHPCVCVRLHGRGTRHAALAARNRRSPPASAGR